jgi:hypothetical protein
MSHSPQQFVLTLLHSITNAHILHFQTKSYSEHVALGMYYEELEDLVDSFVEAYQGCYGIIDDYEKYYLLPTPPLKYLTSLSKYVEDERKKLPQDSELQNIIDEIAQLIDSTIYKLKFLA